MHVFAYALGVSAVVPVFFSKGMLGKQHARVADLSRNNSCSAVLPRLLSIFCGLKANVFSCSKMLLCIYNQCFFPKLLGLCLGWDCICSLVLTDVHN